MNAEHPSPELLTRYFDGDLPAGEAREVEAHRARCDACARELASWQRLRELVVQSASRTARSPAFDQLFANIERAIEVEPAHKRAVSQPARTRGRARYIQRAAPALGAVALAAAALLIVYRTETSPQADTNEQAWNDGAAQAGHSEVVQVDFGRNAGTVFDIPLADGSQVPVVWIDDDGDDDDEDN